MAVFIRTIKNGQIISQDALQQLNGEIVSPGNAQFQFIDSASGKVLTVDKMKMFGDDLWVEVNGEKLLIQEYFTTPNQIISTDTLFAPNNTTWGTASTAPEPLLAETVGASGGTSPLLLVGVGTLGVAGLAAGLSGGGSSSSNDASSTTTDSSNLPYFIEALLESNRTDYQTPTTWSGSGARVINYSFATSAHGGESGFRTYTEAQKESVRNALEKFSELFNITFNEVDDSSSSVDLRFYQDALSSDSILGSTTLTTDANSSHDIHLNSLAYDASDTFAEGTSAFQTLLHEIEHVLGLKHSGDYGDGTSGPFLSSSEDTTANTLMSYNNDGDYKSNLQIFDIASLEYIYGLSDSVRNGDNTYDFTSHYIYDGSGTDTIDASSETGNLTISLTSGSWNYSGTKSSSILSDGQQFIGYDTVIENVSGGSGDDTLSGNAVANRIEGNAGNDTIVGSGGSDTLLGGAGNDTLTFDADDASIDGGSGTDILIVTSNVSTGEFSNVSNIEILNLGSDSSGQQVSLGASDVLNLTDSDNVLRINGTSVDSVDLQNFTNSGVTTDGYTQYTATSGGSTVTVWLDSDIALI